VIACALIRVIPAAGEIVAWITAEAERLIGEQVTIFGQLLNESSALKEFKRWDRPYKEGRSPNWVKFKNRRDQDHGMVMRPMGP
jgi:hypothetical protein